MSSVDYYSLRNSWEGARASIEAAPRLLDADGQKLRFNQLEFIRRMAQAPIGGVPEGLFDNNNDSLDKIHQFVTEVSNLIHNTSHLSYRQWEYCSTAFSAIFTEINRRRTVLSEVASISASAESAGGYGSWDNDDE